MKKMLVIMLSLIPSVSFAQVVTAIWDVDSIDQLDVASIELDIRTEGTYMLVNGITRTSQNDASAAVGSCFFISIGDVICELDVRGSTYHMTIRENLNGTLEIRSDGFLVDEGILFFRE